MRVLLAVACLCLTLPITAQKPAASTSSPAAGTLSGDSPTSGMQRKTDSLDDVVSQPTKDLSGKIPVDDAVKGWTNWTGDVPSPLQPNQPSIKGFGDKLCNKATQAITNACESKDLYIIHIVRFKRDKADPTLPITLTSSNWYFYRRKSKEELVLVKVDQGTFPPTLGAHSAAIVAVVVLENPVCNLGDAKDQCDTPTLKYTVKVNEKMASNEAALIALANGVLGVTSGGAMKAAPAWPHYSGYAQILELDRGHPHLPFDWVITATAVGQRDGKGDCTNVTSDASCSFTHTVSFVAPQYWNVGINITPHGPREYKYVLSNSNIITQSHTIHSPLYAAVDFSPWSQQGYRPYFQAGVPLSGAAFHLPFVSIAEPLPFTKKALQISVYGGVVFMQQTFPRTLQVGQTSNTAAFNADLVTDRALKPIFGIEVPVSSIISKVKSSVGSGK